MEPQYDHTERPDEFLNKFVDTVAASYDSVDPTFFYKVRIDKQLKTLVFVSRLNTPEGTLSIKLKTSRTLPEVAQFLGLVTQNRFGSPERLRAWLQATVRYTTISRSSGEPHLVDD